jgi:hypothetical protein
MTIKRYENVSVKIVTNGVNSLGEYTTTITDWFDSRALVSDVNNSLLISERFRVYSNLVQFMFNYTPNMKTIIDNQNGYAFRYRDNDWRITTCRETNDRQFVMFTCYRNDPTTPV